MNPPALPASSEPPIEAVIFDLGGVVLTSPFEAFARYEVRLGLPEGFIRRLNMDNHDDNAWARLERGELDEAGFAQVFESEARRRWCPGWTGDPGNAGGGGSSADGDRGVQTA